MAETFEELKQEAIQIITERRQAEERETERKNSEKQALFDEVMARAIARIDESLPEPLRQFVVYAGPELDMVTLRKFPRGFMPCDWRIEEPSIGQINFSTRLLNGGGLTVQHIRIGDEKFGADWHLAIFRALELQGTLPDPVDTKR